MKEWKKYFMGLLGRVDRRVIRGGGKRQMDEEQERKGKVEDIGEFEGEKGDGGGQCAKRSVEVWGGRN